MHVLLKAALVHVLIILNNRKENVLHEELLYFPIMFSYTPETQSFLSQSIMLKSILLFQKILEKKFCLCVYVFLLKDTQTYKNLNQLFNPLFFLFLILFNFTILYWFCHTVPSKSA